MGTSKNGGGIINLDTSKNSGMNTPKSGFSGGIMVHKNNTIVNNGFDTPHYRGNNTIVNTIINAVPENFEFPLPVSVTSTVRTRFQDGMNEDSRVMFPMTLKESEPLRTIFDDRATELSEDGPNFGIFNEKNRYYTRSFSELTQEYENDDIQENDNDILEKHHIENDDIQSIQDQYDIFKKKPLPLSNYGTSYHNYSSL